ncbi:A24 family peptidase [Streptomyces sp. NBC_00572]|uniref:prepilin peptidase n=1 Tax=Streptomyces sp. NBC_00572 TaxID=2903664 RepID=UPI00225749CA|nr:A24 family peptidase [Streptomyces sp. NBC_00572]MCX4983171.1 A24 family peptidase [Streptomyces sp. NBC_00572]
MYVTMIALAALWGAAAGLLVPRAAYRLSVAPEEPWRDRCPAGHALAGPARGWLGGPGRRECATAAGPFAAPLLTALACAALAAATGGPRPELVVWLVGAPFAVLLASVDARVHRLPDGLTLPLAAAVPLLLGVAELLPYDAGSWPHAVLGALALGGAYLVLFLVNPSGLGFGDVKLALPLGAALGWYGWGVLFAGAFAGFLLGAVYGLGLVLLRRADRSSAIPFGPFMLAGGLAGLLLGAFTALP